MFFNHKMTISPATANILQNNTRQQRVREVPQTPRRYQNKYNKETTTRKESKNHNQVPHKHYYCKQRQQWSTKGNKQICEGLIIKTNTKYNMSTTKNQCGSPRLQQNSFKYCYWYCLHIQTGCDEVLTQTQSDRRRPTQKTWWALEQNSGWILAECL